MTTGPINLNDNKSLQPVGQPSATQPGATQNSASSYNNSNSVQPTTTQQNNASTTPATPQPKAQGTGYNNVQDYYSANQGNNLGQAVSGGVQNVTNQANNNLNTAQNQYQQQYGQAQQTQQTGQNLYNTLNPYANLGNWSNPSNAENAINSANTAQNQQAVQQLNNGYYGPQGLGNADQSSAQASALQQLAQGLNTSGGRQAALQQFVGGNNQYTQGQQGLDAVLLGQNPTALNEARNQALQSAANINNTIGRDQSQAQNLATQYGTTAGQLGNLLNNQLGSTMGSYLTNAATNQNNANIKTNADIQAVLSGKTSADTLTPDEQTALYAQFGGQDPSKINTYTLTGQQIGNALTAQNGLTQKSMVGQNELAATNALGQLSGGRANGSTSYANGIDTSNYVNGVNPDTTSAFTAASQPALQNLLNGSKKSATDALNAQQFYDLVQGKNVNGTQYQQDAAQTVADIKMLQGVLPGSDGTPMSTNAYANASPELTALLNSIGAGIYTPDSSPNNNPIGAVTGGAVGSTLTGGSQIGAGIGAAVGAAAPGGWGVSYGSPIQQQQTAIEMALAKTLDGGMGLYGTPGSTTGGYDQYQAALQQNGIGNTLASILSGAVSNGGNIGTSDPGLSAITTSPTGTTGGATQINHGQ